LAETAAAHAIFFVATILIAVALVGAFTKAVTEFTDNLEDRSNRMSEDMRSDIKIVNSAEAVPYRNGSLTLYVKNTGRTVLENDTLVVLVDGHNAPVTALAILGGYEVWSEARTANITATVADLAAERDHHLKVIVMQDTEDDMIFRIREY